MNGNDLHTSGTAQPYVAYRLGCQENSSVAWALRDASKMLQAVKLGWDVRDRGVEKVPYMQMGISALILC